MKFEDWLRTGPLAEETLSERERIIAQVAFNEGQLVVGTQNVERLSQILARAEARPS